MTGWKTFVRILFMDVKSYLNSNPMTVSLWKKRDSSGMLDDPMYISRNHNMPKRVVSGQDGRCLSIRIVGKNRSVSTLFLTGLGPTC